MKRLHLICRDYYEVAVVREEELEAPLSTHGILVGDDEVYHVIGVEERELRVLTFLCPLVKI
jgi:hypothetical protein